MKKILLILTAALIGVVGVGCAGAKVTPSFATPSSWKSGIPVYEYAEYKITRYSAPDIQDRYNPKGHSIATGTQTVTVQNCTDAEYPDCLEILNTTDILYTEESFNASGGTIEVGATTHIESRVVFSIGTSNIMETRYAEKTINSSADPSLNLDYTARYGGGLSVTSYALDEEGERISDGNGGYRSTRYSFKSKHVSYNMYDNDQWMLLNRYGSGFGTDWSSSYTLVSVPDIIYNGGKLTTFTVQAQSQEEMTLRNLEAMTENIRLSETDLFAQEVADAQDPEKKKYQASCADVTMTVPGSMNINYGPVIYSSYIATREVDKVELANLLVGYAQNEYSTAGQLMFSTSAQLVTASVTRG